MSRLELSYVFLLARLRALICLSALPLDLSNEEGITEAVGVGANSV